MFTTIEKTTELTGKEVTQETIIMAQNIIEAYIGRDEIDVIDPTDRALLNKAVAYQAAYMFGDEARTFEQMNAVQVMQYGQMITFNNDGASPWVAPLAVLACKRLSWHRIRSIRTGALFPREPVSKGWAYE